MGEPRSDTLKPTGKEPVEGGRADAGQGAPPKAQPEESHLGAAGDPVEGKDDDD